jgi:TPR repeat protein
MNAKKVIILLVFTVLLIFSFVSRIFFNDFQDGWNAYEKMDYKTARELWLPLAEQGEPRAQFFLGFMHDLGLGVSEDDKKAIKWYELAAEQGDSRAQLFAGYIYDFGYGVPEDDQKAFKWYRLSAEQGYEQAKIRIYDLAKKNFPEALKILKTDAENGEDKAQLSLGEMYEYGQGVRQDYKEAVKWYRNVKQDELIYTIKSTLYKLAKKNVSETLKILVNDAEKGSSRAQQSLGVMYEFGQGVRKDYKEAVKWYSLSKKQKNVGYKAKARSAIYKLAKKNVSEALEILVNDAEKGSVIARRQLSRMYQLGLGVSQDNHEALKWYQFDAEHVFAQAKTEMVKWARKNGPQTLKTLSNDAENGSAEAQMKLGMIYQLGLEVSKDEKRAVEWYRLAADQGVNKAQLIMGLMYAKGQGVPQDNREAMIWYRLATKRRVTSEKDNIYELATQNVPQALKILTDDAEKGITKAQMNLGMMYQMGFGVPKDLKKAFKWYQLVAEKGDTDAQSILGLMYANGQGVLRDDQEALKWFQLAEEKRAALEKTEIYKLAKISVSPALKVLKADAENGIAGAQYDLGMMYSEGSGVLYDPVLAHMWYNLSALQGHDGATGRLSLIEKVMSPQQIEQAQEMVSDWKQKE